jgi:membrane-anchored glycerophosphoryl diester phosphodiesterase (GDPDase)
MDTRLPIPGPLGLGDLLDRAFRLYRARFAILLLTATIFLVPLGLLSGLLTGRFMTSYMAALEGLVSEPVAQSPDTVFGGFFAQFAGLFGLTFLISVVGLLVSGIVTLALIVQCAATLHNEAISLDQGIRRGLRRFWALIGMAVVQWISYAIATLAVVVPVILLFGAILAGGVWVSSILGDSADSPMVIIGAILLILSGYLLLMVLMVAPALYLSSRWIVAAPGLVVQEWGALDALRRSWHLTRRQVWRCMGYRVLLFLLMGLVISAPLGIFQQLLLVFLPSSAFGLITAISAALSSIVNVIWQPFYVGAIVLLYYDLRVRQEGYDLALQVERLEAEVAGGS